MQCDRNKNQNITLQLKLHTHSTIGVQIFTLLQNPNKPTSFSPLRITPARETAVGFLFWSIIRVFSWSITWLFANRHKPTGFTSLPQSRRILPSQNRGYQFFYVAVWILLLFYHGYIWESIEIRGNVSIHVLEKNAIQPELFCTLPSFAWKLQMKSSMDKMCGHIVVQGAGECSQVW